MSYKWKPSASQRKAFAKRMADPSERAEYEAKKAAKKEKHRSTSKFSYQSAGGCYVPTKEQHDFCLFHWPSNTSAVQEDARNQVMYGYSTGEKVHHDQIHIVNELRRGINAI